MKDYYNDAVGEIYNLGGHNERNNLHIVKRILSELGKLESLITHVADRHGHDLRYAVDPHKANVELGRDPLLHLRKALRRPSSGTTRTGGGWTNVPPANTRTGWMRTTRTGGRLPFYVDSKWAPLESAHFLYALFRLFWVKENA